METQNLNYFLLVTFVILWIIFCTIAQISMKFGVNQLQNESLSGFFGMRTILQFLTNKFILGGLLLYTFATFLWLGALSKLDISILSPLGSLIFVSTAIFAFVFLNEKISPLRWFSIILIFIGTFLLIRS